MRTAFLYLTIAIASLFASCTPVSSYKLREYEVGDLYYNHNGAVEGVVFHVSDNGQHGKVIHLLNSVDVLWYEARDWAQGYGKGWDLPTREELLLLAKNKNIINTVIEANSGTQFMVDYVIEDYRGVVYWSLDEYDSNNAYIYQDGGVNEYVPKTAEGLIPLAEFRGCAVKSFSFQRL